MTDPAGVHVRRIWLEDFRNYRRLELTLSPELTVVVGDNGQGKTNLVEALAWLSDLASFRGAATDALVRVGAQRAIVRAEIVRDARELLVEAEIPRSGRTRVLVNRQRLGRVRDLLDVVTVSVFAPDDLRMVKDGPGGRRRFIDDLLVALHAKNERARSDYDRIIRQRNALLKQSRGRLTDDIATTLEVWNTKLTTVGEHLADLRADTLAALAPGVEGAYRDLAGDTAAVGVSYVAPWREDGLAAALDAARDAELRRGVSLVGPHRDEIDLTIDGLASRSHASQGEQRTLALALRLAGHRLIAERTGVVPLLVLDDVFSELDPRRCAALVDNLPAGQALVTTAGAVPEGLQPERLVRIADGELVEVP